MGNLEFHKKTTSKIVTRILETRTLLSLKDTEQLIFVSVQAKLEDFDINNVKIPSEIAFIIEITLNSSSKPLIAVEMHEIKNISEL